jgi:hypothetical protein
MKCPIPKPASKLITAAGPTMVPCDGEATVTTLAPFTERRTGETQFQFVQTCLHHAISIACWKLTVAIDEQLRQAAAERRIHTF